MSHPRFVRTLADILFGTSGKLISARKVQKRLPPPRPVKRPARAKSYRSFAKGENGKSEKITFPNGKTIDGKYSRAKFRVDGIDGDDYKSDEAKAAALSKLAELHAKGPVKVKDLEVDYFVGADGDLTTDPISHLHVFDEGPGSVTIQVTDRSNGGPAHHERITLHGDPSGDSVNAATSAMLEALNRRIKH